MGVYVLVDEGPQLGFVLISNFTAFPLPSCDLTTIQSVQQLFSVV